MSIGATMTGVSIGLLAWSSWIDVQASTMEISEKVQGYVLGEILGLL